MQKLRFVVKNLNQVSVMFRIRENVHCQWAHLSSKALVKSCAIPESWLQKGNNQHTVDAGGSGTRKGDHIQATGETSWILLDFQHWKRGTVSASNSISLTLHYDKVCGLPGDFPKLSVLLKPCHLHCFCGITASLLVKGTVQDCKTCTLENVLR